MKTKTTLVLIVAAAVSGCGSKEECVPATSAPACPESQKMVFSCLTPEKRPILVCDSGSEIQLSIGNTDGTNHVVVTSPRDLVTTTQWSGFGSSHTYSIDVPSGQLTYNVAQFIEEIQEEIVPAGEVTITDGPETISYKCDGDTVKGNIEGIDLARTVP